MKRAVLLLSSAIAVIFSACKKEDAEIPQGTPVDTSLQVTLDGWEFSKGDKLSLVSGNYTASLTATEAGSSVTFSGQAPKLPASESYIAIYPAGEYALDGRSLNVTLPQTAVPEKGRLSGAVAVGVTSGGSLKLNHVTAFVRFSISREDISSLVLRSSGKSVAGDIKVSIQGNGTPTVTLAGGADAVTVSEKLTPGTYTIPVPAQGYNGFTVNITADKSSAVKEIVQAKRLNPGQIMELGTIDSGIDFDTKAGAPILELIRTSSSTAAVTWSISGFNDVYADIAPKWSAGIYNDAACTDLRVSWNFPTELWTVYGGNNISTLEGPYSPRFIFSGLEASKDYYVKVWYTENPEIESATLKVSTLPAAYKTISESFAQEGEVILEEDFSELPWGGDVATRSFGYSNNNRSSAPAFDSAFGANPAGDQEISGFKHSWYFVYPGTEMGLFNTCRSAVSNSRLKDWTSIAEDNSDGKVLARPGYIKLGSSSKTGAVVTPVLSSLEQRARVRLTFKAHPFREAVNDPLTASVMVVSSEETGTSVLKSYSSSQQVDFSIGEAQEWKEYSFEFMVMPNERLAISSRRVGSDANQRRLLIDDIKVELLEYKPVTKVTSIKDTQDWLDFVSGYASYEAGETVTIENDLDLEGVSFSSIPSFIGTLDGQGHAIKNWTSDGSPLFTTLGRSEGEGGTVKNLVLDASCTLTPSLDGNFGFIAATVQASGIIDGIQVKANAVPLNVTTLAAPHLGMIAGVSYGIIQNCVNDGNLSVTSAAATGNAYVGGIVGYINAGDRTGLLGNQNNGDITYTMNGPGMFVYLGGITAGTSTSVIADAKNSKGTVENCINTGKVTYTCTNGGSMAQNEGTGRTGNYFKVGGVAGYFEGNVIGCTNRGDVSVAIPTKEDGACATGPSIGGVAAFVLRDMTGCKNYGKVSISGTFAGGGTGNQGCGITGEFAAGGVVGQIGASVNPTSYSLSDCHNYGELNLSGWMSYTNGTGFNFGGVAGYSAAPVSNCSNNASMLAECKGAYVRMGGVVGNTRSTASSLENNGALDFRLVRSTAGAVGTYKQLASELRIGGVIGLAVGNSSELANKAAMALTTTAADDLAANLQIGGAVGYTQGTLTASNSGKITVTYSGKQVKCGGVLGESTAQSLSGCVNTGNMDITCGSIKQSWFGGVFGSIPAPSSGNNTHTGLENRGNIDLTITTSQDSGFYYLGGVAGTSAAYQVYTDCKNYGDITYTGHAKMRIGGINGYMNRTANGSVVECDITANCNGRDYSEVGGISAYTAATDLRDWSFSGSINTSGSTKKVYTGGLLGKSNGNNAAFNGCRFSGSLSGGGSYNTPGLYVGGLQVDNLSMSFGNETKCIVGAGSKVNGTEVTSLTNENLVSQSSCDKNYSADENFTSTSMLTNIVIE